MQNKFFIVVTFLFVFLYNSFSLEQTDDIVVAIKNQIDQTIYTLNEKKVSILTTIMNPNKATNPEINSYLVLKQYNLSKIFIFDECNIMVKEVSYENGIFSSKLLNYYNVALQKTKMDKIYLSPLFIYKNICYYVLGAKNKTNMVLFLFKIPIVANHKYCLLDSDGEVLANPLGINKDRLASIRKTLLGKDEKAKNELFKSNGFILYLPFAKYYLFY